ncbi:MAG: ribonuclease H-like domain-containing protein [Clostridia bacterium]|nr:ribonuclease H-like domain-containing protein [Clostridia bacterium]
MSDMSSLRSRLRGIGIASSVSPKPSKPAAGLEIRENATTADERLFHLGAAGMKRLECVDAEPDIERILFLDTETTGLSGGVGTVAFLLGLGWVRGTDFHTRQILMKDYASEDMLIGELTRAAEDFDMVVTFNGNTFDLPLLNTRCTMNRREYPLEDMDTLDLLKHSRRLWKRRLGSVRLTRLEEEILGYEREADLPGSEAPERYFEYLRTGDMSVLEEVIEHNRHDIISMSSLLCALCACYDEPDRLCDSADQLSMAITLEKQGERDVAERLYESAERYVPATSIAALRSRPSREKAAVELDRMLRQQGRDEERFRHLERMISAGTGGMFPYTQMAKYHEHELRDLKTALRYANRALELSDALSRDSAQKRVNRLKKRLKNREEE